MIVDIVIGGVCGSFVFVDDCVLQILCFFFGLVEYVYVMFVQFGGFFVVVGGSLFEQGFSVGQYSFYVGYQFFFIDGIGQVGGSVCYGWVFGVGGVV